MTPTKTPFAGLERLAPGDPLSSDGYVFQDLDRRTIDQLLQIGAVTHVHDGHAALANPTLAPVVTSAATGGAFPSGLSVSVTYTLIDANGGESAPVTPVSVAMSAGYSDPTVAPIVAVSYAAGSLLSGNYSYAVTVADGVGGQTALGPSGLAVVSPGYPTAEVFISGLIAAMNSASGGAVGAAWRLWRSQGGGVWYLIGTGTGDTVSDTGIPGDCTVDPPAFGTTQGANTLSVTVPAGQPTGTTNFNVYASLDGGFLTPALMGTYPIASAGTAHGFTAMTPTAGSPPPQSRCFPGANPISAMGLSNIARAAGTPPVNVQIASYTFQQTDVGGIVESTSASPVTFTIPPHSTVPFDYPGLSGAIGGAAIEVFQFGAGQITIAPGSGVTLLSDGSRFKTAGQYATIGLRQRALNQWCVSGDCST